MPKRIVIYYSRNPDFMTKYEKTMAARELLEHAKDLGYKGVKDLRARRVRLDKKYQLELSAEAVEHEPVPMHN